MQTFCQNENWLVDIPGPFSCLLHVFMIFVRTVPSCSTIIYVPIKLMAKQSISISPIVIILFQFVVKLSTGCKHHQFAYLSNGNAGNSLGWEMGKVKKNLTGKIVTC